MVYMTDGDAYAETSHELWAEPPLPPQPPVPPEPPPLPDPGPPVPPPEPPPPFPPPQLPNEGQSIVPAGLANVTAIAAGSYQSVAVVGGGRPFLTGRLISRLAIYGQTIA